MSMLPPPPEPEPIFVAVFDLLGFTRRLIDDNDVSIHGGLEELYATYSLFLNAIGWSTRIDDYKLGSNGKMLHVSGRINSFVASDTVLLWAAEEEASYFIEAVADLVNNALKYRVPLRGAISYGHCIIDTEKKSSLVCRLLKLSKQKRYRSGLALLFCLRLQRGLIIIHLLLNIPFR